MSKLEIFQRKIVIEMWGDFTYQYDEIYNFLYIIKELEYHYTLCFILFYTALGLL